MTIIPAKKETEGKLACVMFFMRLRHHAEKALRR